jgi:hypothetical protein
MSPHILTPETESGSHSTASNSYTEGQVDFRAGLNTAQIKKIPACQESSASFPSHSAHELVSTLSELSELPYESLASNFACHCYDKSQRLMYIRHVTNRMRTESNWTTRSSLIFQVS